MVWWYDHSGSHAWGHPPKGGTEDYYCDHYFLNYYLIASRIPPGRIVGSCREIDDRNCLFLSWFFIGWLDGCSVHLDVRLFWMVGWLVGWLICRSMAKQTTIIVFMQQWVCFVMKLVNRWIDWFHKHVLQTATLTFFMLLSSPSKSAFGYYYYYTASRSLSKQFWDRLSQFC